MNFFSTDSKPTSVMGNLRGYPPSMPPLPPPPGIFAGLIIRDVFFLRGPPESENPKPPTAPALPLDHRGTNFRAPTPPWRRPLGVGPPREQGR